jgi:D-alanyl-D-alanine dipeptidase
VKNKSLTLSMAILRPSTRILILFLALVSCFAPRALSQVATRATTPAEEFVGTYKEPTTERRVSILEKGGQLYYQSADGLSVTEFHLTQPLPGDLFEIVETNTRQEVSFFRDKSGKIAGLKFAGRTFRKDPSNGSEATSSSESSSGPAASPAPFPGLQPSLLPRDLNGKTGDFADQTEKDVLLILERSRRLYLRDSGGLEHVLKLLRISPEGDQTSFTYTSEEADPSWVLGFKQHASDPVWQLFTQIGPYHRLSYSVPAGSTSVNLVKPLRALKEIRAAALAATPPEEQGTLRKNDLVELANLDPAIRLDIRYATTNNFLGSPVYTQARAFLQRPAVDALLRALRRLQPLGYGFLIHDGYRPWYVTKIFWDATPESGKIFVADPAQGSRHNRGCAVDLTLYDLKTNQPVEMTGLFDEMSPRSFPDYSGGTSLQRWHRDLLRWAMEAEGFTVFEAEWWHFDYKDWREYAISNIPFEKLDAHPK